jgi:hypothetical protein
MRSCIMVVSGQIDANVILRYPPKTEQVFKTAFSLHPEYQHLRICHELHPRGPDLSMSMLWIWRCSIDYQYLHGIDSVSY